MPRRLVVLARAFPARGGGHRRPARPVHPRRRLRPRPRRRRPLAGPRGQPAHPERRLLRARQPRDHDAHASPTGSPNSACARSTPTPGRCSTTCAPSRRAPTPGRRRADRRGAHARRLQLGLLRARVPGAADGGRARRGPRPLRARQPRLHAHHARAPAGRRHLPPRRRRVPRSRSPSAPSRCSASPGLLGAVRTGQRRARERDRHGRRRRQGRLPLRAGRSSATTSARSRSSATCRRTCRRPRAARVRARQPRLAGGEGGQRERRLRHADRPAARQEAARSRSSGAAIIDEPARLHRPAGDPPLAAPIVRARRATGDSGHAGGPPRRPAAVHPERAATASRVLPGRPDARRARRGSLVVNSSQGGGSKDTWVLQ